MEPQEVQTENAYRFFREALMETSSQFEEEPRLTQELSDIYVDTVYVYDTERVEVVLNNEDVIRGIIDRIQSKAGKR